MATENAGSDRIRELEARIRELERDTPQARQAQYEADRALADLAESETRREWLERSAGVPMPDYDEELAADPFGPRAAHSAEAMEAEMTELPEPGDFPAAKTPGKVAMPTERQAADMAVHPEIHPAQFPDHTRTEAAMQVRVVSHAPTGGLEGAAARAVIRARRERQAREAQMRSRFGCLQPSWAAEYIRTGRVRQTEREAGG